MRLHRIAKSAGLLALALGPGLIALALLLAPERSVQATPHVLSRADHPYDPDWPLVEWILANKCAGCHRAGTERTDLTTYGALMAARYDGKRVVAPGSAARSPLFQQVVWNAHGRLDSKLPDSPEMPHEPEERLTAGQLEIIRRWIDNGARQYRPGCEHQRAPVMETDFPSAKQCAACHPKQYDEWSRSMHAYAQHSPIFEAFNLTLLERTSGTIGTFCSRCHTPIGTALGENGLRRNVNRSRISMEGITCVVCHRRSTRRHKSSGRVSVEPGKLLDACMYGPFESSLSEQVGSHGSKKLPYIKTSQFCGECHDVTSPAGVRLEEAFSEWQNSPAARQGQTCQSCHMGPVQGIPIPDDRRPLGPAAEVPGVPKSKMPLRRLTDHTFAGPDYSMLPDTEFPHKLDWMYETDYRRTRDLTPYQRRTLDRLRRKNRRALAAYDAKRFELMKNAAEIAVAHPDCAAPGAKIKLRVDVTNKVAGHSLPTGFTAERQLWVEITLRDSHGRVVFASGDLDKNGDLRDEHSHAVLAGKVAHDKYLLNFQNKFIALSQKGTERSVVLSVNRFLHPLNIVRPAPGISASFGRPPGFRIAKGSLPPLATIGRTYPVRLPREPGVYLVEVKLNFRHLPPALLDHIGTPHLKRLLQILEIDGYRGQIVVGGPAHSEAPARLPAADVRPENAPLPAPPEPPLPAASSRRPSPRGHAAR